MLDRCNTHGMIGFWVRAPHMEGFQNRSITTVVREGDRSNPSDTRHAPEGEDLAVRFIKKVGDGSRGIKAELYPDDGTTVRRVGMKVKRLKDLTEEDLKGSTLDTRTPELVRYHLAMVANSELPSWETVVTVWHLEYVG